MDKVLFSDFVSRVAVLVVALETEGPHGLETLDSHGSKEEHLADVRYRTRLVQTDAGFTAVVDAPQDCSCCASHALGCGRGESAEEAFSALCIDLANSRASQAQLQAEAKVVAAEVEARLAQQDAADEAILASHPDLQMN